MTETVSPALSVGEDIFKAVIWDIALDAELAVLFYYCPFLAVPIVQPIITNVAHMISDGLFKRVRKYCDMAAVPFINAERKAAFTSATVSAKIIGMDKGIESPEYKKAKEEARAAWIAHNQFNA
jgi:hypothetical protein